MDAGSLYMSGCVHFINEEFGDAVKHFTCALTLEDGAEHRTARAAAYLKLGLYSEVLEDCAAALKFEPKYHMAHHWAGIAMFYTGNFVGAKSSFETSIAIAPNAKAPRAHWLRKCDAEMSGSTLPLAGATVTPSKTSAMPITVAAPVAPVALPVCAQTSAPAAALPATESVKDEKMDLSISGRKPVRMEWHQNQKSVFVTLFSKGVAAESCNFEFKAKELSVSFPLPGSDGEEYQLEADLFEEVDPTECKHEVSKLKVEITLAKKTVGLTWPSLERKALQEVAPAQPAYPTSNKQQKDWASYEKQAEEELKDKPEGEEALNGLFKQIYERADPETRRAMNKSFQTSGGTVLSTNWGEVSSSDYEGKDRPSPPTGQEWRKN